MDPKEGTMNDDECVCGHVEDEHEDDWFQSCSLCDCPLYELYEAPEG
jgi:hypothetical protein